MSTNKCMKQIVFLTVIFSTFLGFGQTFSITGVVQNATNGDPLFGASVVQKGTLNGAISDFDGNFTLENISSGDVLTVSYVGFSDQVITITSTQNITVEMREDVASLDEIVVIGYGTKKKKEITGAVSVISAETIEELKPVRIEQALQGQVSGVQITSQSGSPGSALDIRIRGISTNGDNRPLILVDGARIEDLSVINPSDIETINVLKDATAGIYGVQAANGVILITTKTGRKQMPLTFEYEAYGGFQETTRSLPALNATEYGLLVNEAFVADGQVPVFTNINELGKGTDWQSKVFQKAPILNNSFTLRGGSKKSTYSGGASLLTQDGIVGGDKANFTRYTSRLNFNTELFDRLKLKSSLLYTGTKRKTLQENGIGSVLYNALNMNPNLGVRDETGGFSRAIDLPIEVINPLAQIESTFNDVKVDKISGVFGANYSFLKNFTAEANYQWNYAEVRGKFYFPEADFGRIGQSDKVFDREIDVVVENLDFFRDYIFDAFITYDNTFADDHKINFTLGTSVSKTTGDSYSRTGVDLPNVPFAQVSVDDAVTITDNFMTRSHRIFDTRLLSYFTRLQYDYKGKYLFSGVFRRDGSTAFGPKNKFGYFPSASMGWIISDEDFLAESNAINFLKLRGSYGIIGNDRIPSNRFVSLLTGEGVYVFDDNLEFGIATGAISNPEIKWEEQKTLDIGIDTRFLDNRLSIEADYFNKRTENLLLAVQASGTTGPTAPGAASPIVNAGTVENKGFEFAIGYKDELSDNFSFGINYNFTTLNNKVLEVNNNIGFEPGGAFGIGQSDVARLEEGLPIGYYFGYATDGIFQTQEEANNAPSQLELGAEARAGDLKFVDTNGDGVITPDDKTNLGDPIPDITMGLNLSFDYGNFDFQSYFFASLGNDIVRNYERNDRFTNRTTYYLDRWTGTGTSNEFPRVTTGATANTVFSDFYVEDGSFLRAQNMQLGYSFPESTLSKLGIEKLRFYVSVNNAFTLTKYRGYDPTVSTGAPVGGGFDQGLYPTPRTYLLGVNMKL